MISGVVEAMPRIKAGTVLPLAASGPAAKEILPGLLPTRRPGVSAEEGHATRLTRQVHSQARGGVSHACCRLQDPDGFHLQGHAHSQIGELSAVE